MTKRIFLFKNIKIILYLKDNEIKKSKKNMFTYQCFFILEKWKEYEDIILKKKK